MQPHTVRIILGLVLVAPSAWARGCATAPDVAAGGRRPATYVLGDEPLLSIGGASDANAFRLDSISDATLRADGSVAMVSCQSSEVLYFDPDGRHLRSVELPHRGEENLGVAQRIVRLGGDTLGVTDWPWQDLTRLAPDGSVLGVIAPDPPDPFRHVIGRLSDGAYVARRYVYDHSLTAGTTYRSTASLYRLGPDGSVLDSVARLPSTDLVASGSPRSGRNGLRLARVAVFAVGEDVVYYGAQDGAGILELSPDLDVRTTTRTLTRPRPITEEDQVAYGEMLGARAHVAYDGGGGSVSRRYAEEMPAFGDIVAGRDGRLWVQDPERPWIHPLRWTGYRHGAAVAHVELPPRFFPFEFGRDWVLGVSYDAIGVERVQLRRLEPGPLPGLELSAREAQPPGRAYCGAWASR